MRHILCVICFLLAGCALPYDDAARTPLSTVSANYISLSSGIPLFFGYTASAVVVADGLAITNRHVVEASSQMQGMVAGIGMIPVEVLGVSERMDLALLRIPRGIGRPVAMGKVTHGERVWLMGTPSPFDAPVVRGTVENGRGWSCSVELDGGSCRKPQYGLIVQAAGASGYSGGPVVDRHGRLVAITQGIFTTAYAADGTVLQGGTRMFAYPISDALAEVAALHGELSEILVE